MGDSPRGAAGGDQSASPAKRAWTVALFVVSLAAVGVMIGVLLPWPEADQAPTATPLAASAASSVQSSPASSPTATPKVVDEPFDPKAAIPGCDKVEQPGKASYSMSFATGEPSYDNPKFPWFSGPKATAMSKAVAESLPAGAEIQFASPIQSLVFQPIVDSDSTGSTIASGSVLNGNARGGVFITVQKSSTPVPPCVAGELDARRTLGDGTVVDVHDTWREVDGVRTISRTAEAYVADGSRIRATADDSVGSTEQKNSGTIPLSVDDLVRIVSDPRLRVTTAVPSGTPAPDEGCRGSFGGSDGPAVTREQARKLDMVLASIDFGGPKPKPLQLNQFTNGTLCTQVPRTGTDATLDISIVGGQKLPLEERPDPVSGAQSTWRKLQDGTVVQTRNGDTVIVTRPGGTQITVDPNGATPIPAPPLARLESIALTPGLEL